MSWPYKIVKLSPDQRYERRILLDRYGLYAQLSALLPIAIFLLVKLTQRILRKTTSRGFAYDAVQTSPGLKHGGESPTNSLSARFRRGIWWLGDDVELAGLKLGRRDHLIFGGIWTAWLLFLCVDNTGNDYSHLTRRFGIVGTSQFPMQYLLSTKRLNPVAFIFGTSHEIINRWHRVLGWLSYFIISIHGVLYLNYYIQVGGLGAAFFRPVPVLGMLGLCSMTLLSTTTLSVIRRYSYRIFFVTHLLVALAIPPIIWFHVPHARVFMAESLFVLVADRAVRRFSIVTSLATVDMIPNTDLIKVVAKVPRWKIRQFGAHPGSHAYLSIPPASRPTQSPWSLLYLRFEFMSNPFTAASVNEEAEEITLVARQMDGPMTNTLARLASLRSADARVALHIDGPYGVAAYFDNLAGTDFDRFLLVAGGVGATFIVPLYEHIKTQNPSARVEMVWAVRNDSDANWPVSVARDSIYDDDGIRLFLTGNKTERTSIEAGSSKELDDVELSRLDTSINKCTTDVPVVESHERPDLERIVDGVFRQSYQDRVAVVVCGPAQMGRDLRKAVGIWVKMGRDVWFHNESFIQ